MAKRQTVGDITEDLVVLGGLGILGYFLVTKFFSAVTPPPTSGTTNNAANAASAAAAAAADAAASAAAGSKQTLTNNQLAAMAATISDTITNMTVGDDNSLSNIIETVDQINTQQDWDQLVVAFGVQKFNSSLAYWSYCNMLGYDCQSMNLPAALTLVLSGTPYQATLNQFFTAQGINAQI